MAKVEVTRERAVNQIMVDEYGNTHVRTVTRYMDGARVISEEYHRHVLMPGDDVSGEADAVKKIAKAAWTPEMIKAAQAKRQTSPF